MKFICRECGPFSVGAEITGCPKCREVNTLNPACSEPYCWLEVAASIPSPDGEYRGVCRDHFRAFVGAPQEGAVPHD